MQFFPRRKVHYWQCGRILGGFFQFFWGETNYREQGCHYFVFIIWKTIKPTTTNVSYLSIFSKASKTNRNQLESVLSASSIFESIQSVFLARSAHKLLEVVGFLLCFHLPNDQCHEMDHTRGDFATKINYACNPSHHFRWGVFLFQKSFNCRNQQPIQLEVVSMLLNAAQPYKACIKMLTSTAPTLIPLSNCFEICLLYHVLNHFSNNVSHVHWPWKSNG